MIDQSLITFDIKSTIILVVGALNLLSGVMAHIKNSKSRINFWFFILISSISVWQISMVMYRGFTTVGETVLWARILYAAAITIPLSSYFFAYVFCDENTKFSIFQKIIIPIPIIVLFIASLLPSSLIYTINFISGEEKQIIFNQFFHFIYGLTIISYFGWIFYKLFEKYFVSNEPLKTQIRFLIAGLLVQSTFGVTTNLIFPFFGIFSLNWFGQVANTFMIIIIAYAIVKHHLFNVKVIATELLTVAIWIFLFIEVLISKTVFDASINGALFVLVVFSGIFLIRSVLNEVRAREQIEQLAGDLEKANSELKRLDQAKSEFISIASHQLRTPLSIIKGYISLIREGSYGKVELPVSKTMNKIYLSNERLIKLVADLLDLSRMESGKLQYEFADFDFVGLVGSIVDEFKIPMSDKGIDFKWKKPEESITIWGDSWKLRQVIFNLIDNSLKYTPSGSIEVFIEKSDNTVTLAVKDTGVGMSPETTQNLFKKFSRGEKSSTVNVQGLGLGLFIAKKIVDDHHGALRIASDGEGKGSIFYLDLPIKHS